MKAPTKSDAGPVERDFDAIMLAKNDSVATVLHAVKPSDVVRVKCGGSISLVTATEAIPLYHKISLINLALGTPVLKYGSAIGTATSVIPAGALVHTHNLKSERARRHVPQNGSKKGHNTAGVRST